MTMISYAQNREDVLLNRVFEGKRRGFYVDVGAGDPTEASVTRHFYDLGWNGINVEPGRAPFERLERERLRDINLRVAISNSAGEAAFFRVLHPKRGGAGPRSTGLSSLSSVFLDVFRQEGLDVQEDRVETRTLAKVLEQHAPAEVDFLKVDVEGWERQVLEGGDWASVRPRVLIVEAVDPVVLRESLNGAGTTAGVEGHASSEQWEPLVLEAGYTFAYFDGLNRFYARQEEPELVARLAVQANPLDDFLPHAFVESQFELAKAQRRWKSERAMRLRLDQEVHYLMKQLQILHASRSWNITRPMRRAMEIFKELRGKAGGQTA